jgi:phage protein D
MSQVAYTLYIDDQPAAQELIDVIQKLEVEDHAEMADMVRLTVAIGVADGCSTWNVVDDNTFQRLSKLHIDVNVGSGRTEPLIEAYVIETNADFANQPGQSVLNVVAMEPTVLMNLNETVHPWPNMADSDIASEIFGSYKFGTAIDATQPSRDEVDHTEIQHGTDIQFLQGLAKRNGYECYVEINPQSGVVEGHFHAPRLQQTPQGVLSVNMGLATNVNSFHARFDMLKPATASAQNVDVHSKDPQAADSDSVADKSLGTTSTVTTSNPRQVLLTATGLSDTGELQTAAQAEVDRSAWAITAEGELNTIAYGDVLRAKRPVMVRGAGAQFSGTYYVESVLHSFTGDGYSQQFSLKRNAAGVTKQDSFEDSDALPSPGQGN